MGVTCFQTSVSFVDRDVVVLFLLLIVTSEEISSFHLSESNSVLILNNFNKSHYTREVIKLYAMTVFIRFGRLILKIFIQVYI